MFMQRILSTLIALCCGWNLLAGPLAYAQEKADPRQKAAAAFYGGIQVHALDNGLRVYLKPVPESAIVCVMTTYRVGSADEELDQTGLSHYLEHLMFKGTDKLMPGDIDRKTRRGGGQNNAYTTQDFTNYHFEFAADQWETALEIEADRMRNLRIDARHEFEQEKGAVISELDGAEDEPWDLEHKAILPLLFGPKSPYGHPIIGEKAHVRGATAEIIKGHYDRWYHPNNASIVIAGGFDPARALTRIRQLFGSIPSAKLPARKTAEPVQRSGPVYKEFPSKFDVDRILVGFNTVRMGEPEDYVLDVIQGILTNGKTGRLYRRLVVEQEVAAEVRSSNQAGKWPGWFSIELEVMRGVDRKKAERALLDELRRLSEEVVDDKELQRAKRSILTQFIFAHESIHDLADSIANTVATSDLSYLQTYFSRLEAVTAKDVQDVARRLLDPQKRVVVCSKAAKEGVGVSRPIQRDSLSAARTRSWKHRRPRETAPAGAVVGDFSKTKRLVLPNGLTILLWENHRLPIVFTSALVKNVQLYEPAEKAGVAALVGMTLEEGTATRSEEQISEIMDELGGSVSFASNGGDVKVLSTDVAKGLDLLFDCLIRPKFARKTVTRWREHLIAEIESDEQIASARAANEFLKRIYGKHPLGRPANGTAESVEGLTSADCKRFHQSVFVPNNTILVIAGDFDSATIVDEVKKVTSGWKSAELPRLDLPDVEKPAQSSQEIISLPNSAQLNINLGHIGIRRSNPDYYKLLVMDHILGVGTGFTDRLSSKLRDRHGLAYEVSSSITSSAGEEPGVFEVYIGTYADKFHDVKKMLLAEIERFRRDGPTDEEIEETRNYLIGSFPFRFATLKNVADELARIERYGLGFDYHRRFQKEVGGVTRADVLEVAKKYLDIDKMTIVAAGPIDRDGKPLTKPD